MQMWVWMAPNHVKAIWKVLVAENPIVKKLFNFEIGFSVRRSRFGCDSLPAGAAELLLYERCMCVAQLTWYRLCL